MPSTVIPGSAVNPGEGPRNLGGGGSGGGAVDGLTAHITDPTDAHAASAIGYGGGGAWPDGVTNPATTVEGQLDKIIADLGDTALAGGSSGVGASKIGMPPVNAVTYGINYTSTTVYAAIGEVRLASNIGYLVGPNWADATTNPSDSVKDTIDNIITQLAGGTGTAKIGQAAVNDAVHGINYAGTTLYDRLTLLQNAAYHAYDAGPNWLDGTTNPNDSVKDTIDNIVYRLVLAPVGSGADGASKIGIQQRSTWLGGRSNAGATSVFAAIDKIITDLGASTANDDGAERVGASASASGALVSGSVRSQLNALDTGWGKLDRINTWSATQKVNGGTLDGASALSTETIGTTTGRKNLWTIQSRTGPGANGHWYRMYAGAGGSVNEFALSYGIGWAGGATGWVSDGDYGGNLTKYSFDEDGIFSVKRRDATGVVNFLDSAWDAYSELSATNLTLGNTTVSGPAPIVCAITMENGKLAIQNVANALGSDSNPPSGQGIINELRAKNIPKAWGLIETGSSPSLEDGFNIAGISGSGDDILVNIFSDMASANYVVLLQMCSSSSDRFATVNAFSAGQFTIGAYDVSDGADLQLNGVGAAVVFIAFVVFGEQD